MRRRDAELQARELRYRLKYSIPEGVTVEALLEAGPVLAAMADELVLHRRRYAALLEIPQEDLLDDVRVDEERADVRAQTPSSPSEPISDELRELISADHEFFKRYSVMKMLADLRRLEAWSDTVDALEDALYDAHARAEQGAGSVDDFRRLAGQVARIAATAQEIEEVRAERPLPGALRYVPDGAIRDTVRYGFEPDSENQPRLGRRTLAKLRDLSAATQTELESSDEKSGRRLLRANADEYRVLLEWADVVAARDQKLRELDNSLDDAIADTGVSTAGSRFTLVGELAQRAQDARSRQEELGRRLARTGEEFGVDPAKLDEKVLQRLNRRSTLLESAFALGREEARSEQQRLREVIDSVTEILELRRQVREVEAVRAALRLWHARRSVAQQRFDEYRATYATKVDDDEFTLVGAPQDLDGLRWLHQQAAADPAGGRRRDELGQLLELGAEYQRRAAETERLEERIRRFDQLIEESRRVRDRRDSALSTLRDLAAAFGVPLDSAKSGLETLRTLQELLSAQQTHMMDLLGPDRRRELGVPEATDLTPALLENLLPRLVDAESESVARLVQFDSLVRAAATVQTNTVELGRIERVVRDGLVQPPAEIVDPGDGRATVNRAPSAAAEAVRLKGDCAPYAVAATAAANQRARGEEPDEPTTKPREFSLAGDDPVDVAVSLRGNWRPGGYANISEPIDYVIAMHEAGVSATVTLGIDYRRNRGAHLAVLTWDPDLDMIVVKERQDGRELIHRGEHAVRKWAARQERDAERVFGFESENGQLKLPLAEGERPTGVSGQDMPRQLLRGAPRDPEPAADPGPADSADGRPERKRSRRPSARDLWHAADPNIPEGTGAHVYETRPSTANGEAAVSAARTDNTDAGVSADSDLPGKPPNLGVYLAESVRQRREVDWEELLQGREIVFLADNHGNEMIGTHLIAQAGELRRAGVEFWAFEAPHNPAFDRLNNGEYVNLDTVDCGPAAGAREILHAMVYVGIKLVPVDIDHSTSPSKEEREAYLTDRVVEAKQANPDALMAIHIGAAHAGSHPIRLHNHSVAMGRETEGVTPLGERIRGLGYRTTTIGFDGGYQTQSSLARAAQSEGQQDFVFLVDLEKLHRAGVEYFDRRMDSMIHLYQIPGMASYAGLDVGELSSWVEPPTPIGFVSPTDQPGMGGSAAAGAVLGALGGALAGAMASQDWAPDPIVRIGGFAGALPFEFAPWGLSSSSPSSDGVADTEQPDSRRADDAASIEQLNEGRGHEENQCGPMLLRLLQEQNPAIDAPERVGLQGMLVSDFVRRVGGDEALALVRRFEVDPQRAHQHAEAALRRLVASLPAAEREGAGIVVFDAFRNPQEHGAEGHCFRLVWRDGDVHIDDPGKGLREVFRDRDEPAAVRGFVALAVDRHGNAIEMAVDDNGDRIVLPGEVTDGEMWDFHVGENAASEDAQAAIGDGDVSESIAGAVASIRRMADWLQEDRRQLPSRNAEEELHFRQQNYIWDALIQEVEARPDGATARVLFPHVPPNARLTSHPPTRLLQALNQRALAGLEPEIAQWHSVMGGRPARTPAALRAVADAYLAAINANESEIAQYMERGTQTNDPRRARLLYLVEVFATIATGKPLEIVVPGACGLLEARAHQYRFDFRGEEIGDPDGRTLVEDRWECPDPQVNRVRELLAVRPRVVDVAGCDLDPLHATNLDDQYRLAAGFVDIEVEAVRTILTAFEDARRGDPTRIDQESALTWLPRELAGERTGRATIVWDSMLRRYLTPEENTELDTVIEEAGARATSDAPLIHAKFETVDGTETLVIRAFLGDGRRDEFVASTRMPNRTPGVDVAELFTVLGVLPQVSDPSSEARRLPDEDSGSNLDHTAADSGVAAPVRPRAALEWARTAWRQDQSLLAGHLGDWSPSRPVACGCIWTDRPSMPLPGSSGEISVR